MIKPKQIKKNMPEPRTGISLNSVFTKINRTINKVNTFIFVPNKKTDAYLETDKGYFSVFFLGLFISIVFCLFLSYYDILAGLFYILFHFLGFTIATADQKKFRKLLRVMTGLSLHSYIFSFLVVIILGKILYGTDVNPEDPKEFFFNQNIDL